jgi:hypothetical protein
MFISCVPPITDLYHGEVGEREREREERCLHYNRPIFHFLAPVCSISESSCETRRDEPTKPTVNDITANSKLIPGTLPRVPCNN